LSNAFEEIKLRNASVRLLMALALFVTLTSTTRAQTSAYPTKPVKLIAPFPPGAPPEVIGRLLMERLTAAMGQPFVVENRTAPAG
jgi:tripartite-type tricarboxylate transporter receptor subunit TctC